MHPRDTPTILSTLIALAALVLTMIAAIAVALIVSVYKKLSNRPQLNDSEQDVYYSTVGPPIDVHYSTVGPPLPPRSLRSLKLVATGSHVPHGEGTDHSMEEITTVTEMDTNNPGAHHDTNNIIHPEIETEENAAYACGEQGDTMISNPAYATNVSIAPEIETERNEAYEHCQSQCVHSTVSPPLPPRNFRSLLATDSHVPHGEGTDHSMEEITTEMDTNSYDSHHDTNNVDMIHSEIETEENAAYACGEQQDTIISNPAYATNVSIIAPEI